MVTGENTDRRAYSTDKMDRGTGNLKAHSKGRMDRLMSRYTSGRWEVGNESSSRVVVVQVAEADDEDDRVERWQIDSVEEIDSLKFLMGCSHTLLLGAEHVCQHL